ncbi:MAG: hypothetical protein A2Y03_11315 [Omnitrophica WOR_2 bacterium GWF2_38_59]|nr:MAG: hypothetical protein A2Y03_11315 [Omnitrophica WOR_2 bacterium GWF2_38_59]OGX47938.1 MAG: hypothetical protein A2243_01170 [Omnitrophica WOR_2 bacterium RIFOXYA2_FULL_38_17]OGX52414.1 MAG: hypothetical protein A2267_03950 [Omnitrophica WOR_2 bacterium RIFOXYA12_FULL_38_10]OGX56275.1 MAG: hypothetical protein A2447_08490 [Omnitrophica WOR_2 bacterium RIFOXYC2_FULL_38_12]OGX60220.1 MAG: hypothetical protein A2306_08040 [Omnitrophica WOR_2 bacterium RIFOXYB2_FULL_38_16]HBG61051.1 hypothet
MNIIDINLVPMRLRKKKKKDFFVGGFKLPLEVVIGLGGGLIILLFVVHVVLLAINVSKLAKHNTLKASWEGIVPDKEKVDVIISELRMLQNKQSAIKKLTEEEKVIWSQKLNILSDNLPKGVWLRRIAFNEDAFFVEGSAISRQNKEMIGVHKFTANLKQDAEFLTDLTDLELGSIQMRKINKVDVADFLITSRVGK